MRDEFTEWQDYARRGQLLKEDGTSSGQPHETALTISWNAWEARSKLTKPLGREQRRAMIEAAINDCDEEGLRPDMERFAWLIDAVERAHGIRAVQRSNKRCEASD